MIGQYSCWHFNDWWYLILPPSFTVVSYRCCCCVASPSAIILTSLKFLLRGRGQHELGDPFAHLLLRLPITGTSPHSCRKGIDYGRIHIRIRGSRRFCNIVRNRCRRSFRFYFYPFPLLLHKSATDHHIRQQKLLQRGNQLLQTLWPTILNRFQLSTRQPPNQTCKRSIDDLPPSLGRLFDDVILRFPAAKLPFLAVNHFVEFIDAHENLTHVTGSALRQVFGGTTAHLPAPLSGRIIGTFGIGIVAFLLVIEYRIQLFDQIGTASFGIGHELHRLDGFAQHLFDAAKEVRCLFGIAGG
mmetsp:Transcript_26941/g.56874  ORF Transcript_26941/g.56874 Transcript_26941/m.56874 type:complete len:299 (-) Transcript_26941:296-1192(-)